MRTTKERNRQLRVGRGSSFALVVALVALVGALAGCPPPSRYVVASVRSAALPVEDALVAVTCDDVSGYASRTSPTGLATIGLNHAIAPETCTVTAAKPGLRTVRTPVRDTCASAAACPRLTRELTPLGPLGAAPAAPGGAR